MQHRECADCAEIKDTLAFTISHIVCNDCMSECITSEIEELEQELESVDGGSCRAMDIVSELGDLDRELEQL